MTEIQVNKAYIADYVYTGTAKDGRKYEIIVVRAKGKNQPKIAISPTKVPSGVGYNGAFKITSIRSVTHKNWNDHGRWKPGNVMVRANIKSLAQLTDKELAQTENLSSGGKIPEFPGFEELFK